ncbi:MAG: hypothetical protein SFZ03_06765 [Candidatus Melainabacteria bacterium]|nr:hypothetical protein [Candidatus Melainabacteria bacterium]
MSSIPGKTTVFSPSSPPPQSIQGTPNQAERFEFLPGSIQGAHEMYNEADDVLVFHGGIDRYRVLNAPPNSSLVLQDRETEGAIYLSGEDSLYQDEQGQTLDFRYYSMADLYSQPVAASLPEVQEHISILSVRAEAPDLETPALLVQPNDVVHLPMGNRGGALKVSPLLDASEYRVEIDVAQGRVVFRDINQPGWDPHPADLVVQSSVPGSLPNIGVEMPAGPEQPDGSVPTEVIPLQAAINR